MAADVEISDFDAKGFAIDASRLEPHLSKPRVIREAVTAGPPFVGGNGWPKQLMHMAGRILSIASYLSQDHRPPRHLVPSEHYRSLIRSDQVRASELVGIGAARALASKVLHIPHLVLVEEMAKLSNPPITVSFVPGAQTKKTPDLVGQDQSGRWHIVEAKGTIQKPRRRLHQALAQARNIWVSATGQPAAPPTTASGCVTYLGINLDPLLVCLKDPPDDDEPRGEIIVNSEALIQRYYSTFEGFKEQTLQPSIESIAPQSGKPREFAIWRLPGSSIDIGLITEAWEAVAQGSPKQLADIIASNAGPLREFSFDHGAVGPDGVLLRSEVFDDDPNWPTPDALGISTRAKPVQVRETGRDLAS